MNESQTMSNGEGPLVTIAIPTFNRVGFLRNCLSAALSQTYPCFEVLVSDNTSTDGTGEYLATISDPRLRVIRQKSNIGLLPNWNACLMAAKGEYIAFVPDDDSIAPDFLDRCIGLVKLQPRVPAVIALAGTCEVVAGGKSVIYPAIKSKTLGTGIWDGMDILLEFLKHQISVQICTVFMRTEYLRMRGGFRVDLPYAADLAAWAPLLMIDKCGLVNEQCGSFTVHLQAQTGANSLEIKLRDHKEVIESLVEMARTKAGADSVKQVSFIKTARININGNVTAQLIRDHREGGKAVKIIAVIWRYKSDLFARGLTQVNCRKLGRLIILLLVPSRLHSLLHRLRRRG